jgi:hypothetical protein
VFEVRSNRHRLRKSVLFIVAIFLANVALAVFASGPLRYIGLAGAVVFGLMGAVAGMGGELQIRRDPVAATMDHAGVTFRGRDPVSWEGILHRRADRVAASRLPVHGSPCPPGVPVPSYRLPFVAAECDVQLTGRHRVLINARGAALVAVAMARQHGTGTPGELAEALGTRPGRLEPGRYVPSPGATTETAGTAWSGQTRARTPTPTTRSTGGWSSSPAR